MNNAQLQWVTVAENKEALKITKKNSKVLFILQFTCFYRWEDTGENRVSAGLPGGSHRMITKFQSDWPTLEDKWKGGHSLDEITLNWMVQSQDKPWPFHCLLWRKVPFPTAWEYQCSGNKIEVTTVSIKEMSWEKGWDLERTRFKHWIEACLEDLPINFHVPSIILLTITGRLKIPN